MPAASYAIIGGSSTFSIRFPEDLNDPGVRVLASDLVFDTPYGPSAAFKLCEVDVPRQAGAPRRFLTLKMHGWRSGVSRADASRQVFWVFQQAGVRRILAEGGVGAANHLLELRDLVLATDYIDLSVRKDVGLGGPYLLMMRDPVCPEAHRALFIEGSAELARAQAQACSSITGDGLPRPPRRVFPRGIYANTDGRHFESRAEVASIRQMGADIVGQSICPEVYLAREIGACYAGIYMVVNYAEGVVEDWRHEDLKDIFYGESQTVGRIVLGALRALPAERGCGCAGLRKRSLLAPPEEGE